MIVKYVNINKVNYALHKHPVWEILYYTEGKGYLETETENIPFGKGTIILVPPNFIHGTFSKNGSVNISVGGDFNHLFMFDSPIILTDTPSKDGESLVKLIFNNRYSAPDYLSTLCNAYVQFILQNAQPQSHIQRSVNEIIRIITEKFYDSTFDLNNILNESGYAEDYIRAQFKSITGDTPVRYLTKIRIDHAKKLFDIYGEIITVSEAANTCGFDDPIYFSRRFKEFTGVSPDNYKKKNKSDNRNIFIEKKRQKNIEYVTYKNKQ
ncbi:MAG: helix-turn-helix transcriptional regulator [Clostridia bacterium]|nr:helix-turn-helix transcriptional regulator [Clostridia bacterium]